MNAAHGPARSYGYHGNTPARMDHGVARGMAGQPGHGGGMRMAHTQRLSYRR